MPLIIHQGARTRQTSVFENLLLCVRASLAAPPLVTPTGLSRLEHIATPITVLLQPGPLLQLVDSVFIGLGAWVNGMPSCFGCA